MVALVDCNNFFVSCEKVFRPDLLNRPVVILSNNDGCIVALSNDAKALGLKRGNPYFKCKDIIARHNVAVLSGNHRLYVDMSRRVMSVMRRLCDSLEEYSIDEAFLHVDRVGINLQEYGQLLAHTVRKNTGIPVSVGIASTKTLAKIATSFAKKFPAYHSVCLIDNEDKRLKALSLTDIKDVWGVGRRISTRLNNMGIYTATQFLELPISAVKSRFSITLGRTWLELNGKPCIQQEQSLSENKSMVSSRSFATDIYDISGLEQAVSIFSSILGRKLRKQQCLATDIGVYLATNRFRTDLPQYSRTVQIPLPEATNSTSDIANAATLALHQIFKQGFGYKRAAVIIPGIIPEQLFQPNLFSNKSATERKRNLMHTVDEINSSANHKNFISLASSGNGITELSRQEFTSPQFTTRMSDIITIHTS